MKYFISLSSYKLTKEEINLLKREEIQGVVLYGRNIRGYGSTRRFIKEIKSVKAILKIAVDEEGGTVSRFSHLIPNFSQPYCAKLPKRKVREYYRMRSEFLKRVGIDINLAPVVDIALSEDSFVYKRSYGSDQEKLVELSSICIEEQKRVGLASCLKHFPGLGKAKTDPHQGLPVVDSLSFKRWQETDGEVFEELIRRDVEYVLVGHVLYPKVNNEVSSLSKFWIKEVLKDKLRYKGLILADDLCMKAVENLRISGRLVQKAGIDFAIVTDQQHPLIRTLKRAGVP